jgi:hypothetical protein
VTTIAAAPATPRGQDRRAHPWPWRPIARVTWLERRSALISFLVVFVVLAVAIVVERHSVEALYAIYVNGGCVAHPLNNSACVVEDAVSTNAFAVLSVALRVLPLLAGVFVGAPLIASEIESGTFRFTWTQGVGRMRFVVSTVVLLVVFLVASACLLGLLYAGWYAHPFEVVSSGAQSQWQSGLFTTTWWMLASWMLFALLLGTFLGAVIKRTVVAMAATVVVVGGLLVAASLLLPRMLAIGARASSRFSIAGLNIGTFNMQAQPGNGPMGSWLVRGWFTGPGGRALGSEEANKVLDRVLAVPGNDKSLTTMHWLSLHHYTYWVSYQPASRFWVFQGIEGVVVLVLAALLGLATLWVVRHRA